MRSVRGFTLLELLVALAVFALVSVMAYGGLSTVLEARNATEQQAERLRAVQSTLLFLGRDLSQAVNRGIRDAYGEERPALMGGGLEGAALEFTRAGWPNPTGQPRSTLQRVAWRLEERQLVRDAWRVLDRAPDSAPYRAEMLGGVEQLSLRLLGSDGEWQESWPPLTGEESDAGLPRAAEITLELEGLGAVRRLFLLPEGPA